MHGEGQHDATVSIHTKGGTAKVVYRDGQLGKHADNVLGLNFKDVHHPGKGDV